MTGSRRVIYAALAGNTAIALTKFAAAFTTGSSAVLTEAIHSVVDTGNQGLLLLGIRKASKPPDERHPLGHGKEIYFWSFVVAILIFAVGAGASIYEGIKHLAHPRPMSDLYVNYMVLGAAVVFEGLSWIVAWREFDRARRGQGVFEAVRTGKDPTMFVVLFEDTAALLGLLVALGGVGLGQVTGSHVYDGAASILIGGLLGGVAVWLAVETKGLLIGESASLAVRRGIEEIVRVRREIENLGEILTLQMGPESVLVNLSVEYREDLTVNEVEEAVSRLNAEIKRAYPEVSRVFVEVESLGSHRQQMR